MSALKLYAKHCRKMSTAEHKLECPSLPANQPYWSMWHTITGDDGIIQALGWNGPPPTPPSCDGCITAADRALFLQLADEADAFLAARAARQ